MQTGNDRYEISVYQDELTEKGILIQVDKLRKAFPNLDVGFFDIMADRIKECKFTDKRFNDSVNRVIDTCKYTKPSISELVRFDKTIKLIPYEQMCKIALEWGRKVWDRHDKIKVNGVVYWYDSTKVEYPE